MNGRKIDKRDEIELHRSILTAFLKKQVRLVDGTIHILVAKLHNSDLEQDHNMEKTLALMLQGMGVSAHSLLKLSSTIDMQSRDCLSIARSIVELGINIAYIAAGGPLVCEKAHRHALQKAARDRSRSGEIGTLKFQISAPFQLADERLVSALHEFSDRKGHEVRDWTSDNIDKRLKEIRSKSLISAHYLSAAMLSIYRHSSEIIHGTYFGVLFFWGATSQSGSLTDKDQARKFFLTNHLVASISSAMFAFQGVIELLATQYGAKKLSELNRELRNEFGNYVEEHLSKLGSGADQFQASVTPK